MSGALVVVAVVFVGMLVFDVRGAAGVVIAQSATRRRSA